MSNALNIKGHTSTSKPPVEARQIARTSANTIDPSLPLEAIDARRVHMSGAADESSMGGPKHIRERVEAQIKREQDAFNRRWNIAAAKK